jgi:hypothetical protein
MIAQIATMNLAGICYTAATNFALKMISHDFVSAYSENLHLRELSSQVENQK